MKRIKAFTLLEITVSLVISSIVIGIAYYSVLFFSKQYNNYSLKNSVVSDFFLFKESFSRDIEKSLFIEYTLEKTLILHMEDTCDITYHFDTSPILKETCNANDYFDLKCINVNTRSINDTMNIVSSVSLIFQFDKTSLSFVSSKRYSTYDLINTFRRYEGDHRY